MLTVRKVNDEFMFALVAEKTQSRLDAVAQTSTYYHLDQTNKSQTGDYRNPTVTRLTITSATATGPATSITLINEIKAAMDIHRADAKAHKTADSASTGVTATNTTNAITLANILKADANAHFTASGVHHNNDAANTITSANATDQTTLNTLINELKSHANLHFAAAPPGHVLNLIDA